MAKYSDGVNEGFVISYYKDGKIYPCNILKSKLEIVGFILGEIEIIDTPMYVQDADVLRLDKTKDK